MKLNNIIILAILINFLNCNANLLLIKKEKEIIKKLDKTINGITCKENANKYGKSI